MILFLQASFSLTAVLPFFVHEPRINMTTEPSMGPPNFLELYLQQNMLGKNHQHQHGKNNFLGVRRAILRYFESDWGKHREASPKLQENR